MLRESSQCTRKADDQIHYWWSRWWWGGLLRQFWNIHINSPSNCSLQCPQIPWMLSSTFLHNIKNTKDVSRLIVTNLAASVLCLF